MGDPPSSPWVSFRSGMQGDLPLWSLRPEAWLREQYAKGRVSFNRGFRQLVVRDEERVFGDLGQILKFGVRVQDLAPPALPRYGGYDPAGQRRRGHALVSLAADPQRGVYIITEMRLWAGSLDITKGHLVAAAQAHHWHLVGVESVGLQYPFVAMVVEASPQTVVQGIVTGRNKADEFTGIGAMALLIQRGMFTLCMDDPYDTEAPLGEHDLACECPYHEFIRDLDNYPSPGRAYDLVMALWFAWGAASGRLLGDRVQGTEDAVDVAAERAGGLPDEEVSGTFL